MLAPEITQTDKKSTEIYQKVDLQIEKRKRYFSSVVRPEHSKNRSISEVFHPGAPEPYPPPKKKVLGPENGPWELKKLAPNP